MTRSVVAWWGLMRMIRRDMASRPEEDACTGVPEYQTEIGPNTVLIEPSILRRNLVCPCPERERETKPFLTCVMLLSFPSPKLYSAPKCYCCFPMDIRGATRAERGKAGPCRLVTPYHLTYWSFPPSRFRISWQETPASGQFSGQKSNASYIDVLFTRGNCVLRLRAQKIPWSDTFWMVAAYALCCYCFEIDYESSLTSCFRVWALGH